MGKKGMGKIYSFDGVVNGGGEIDFIGSTEFELLIHVSSSPKTDILTKNLCTVYLITYINIC